MFHHNHCIFYFLPQIHHVTPVPKKDGARTCEENKAVICVSCFSKSENLRPVNSVTEALMKTHHPSGSSYSAQNPFLPTTICMSCKNKLVRLSQVHKAEEIITIYRTEEARLYFYDIHVVLLIYMCKGRVQ